jgi:membrane-associated phospholipid phosphatase
MTATVGVLAIGVAMAGLLVLLGHLKSAAGGSDTMMDPDEAEHWLVETASGHPAIRRLVATGDRRFLGGAAVAVSFALVLIAALFVGWVFDSIDTQGGFARFDESVAVWGSENSSSTEADVLGYLTDLGGTPYLLAIMGIVGAIDWARRRDVRALIFLVVVAIGISAINNGLKWMIMRERPPGVHLVGSAGSSFPSGHSAAAAACWLAIALVVSVWLPRRFRPWLFGGALVIAVVVAASRALLGVHWVTDVVAGLVVGWTWFLLVAVAFGGRHQRLGEPAESIATGRTSSS